MVQTDFYLFEPARNTLTHTLFAETLSVSEQSALITLTDLFLKLFKKIIPKVSRGFKQIKVRI